MSAYQVNKETLGRIARTLSLAAYQRECNNQCTPLWILGGPVCLALGSIGYTLTDDADKAHPRDFADFVRDMAQMNADAVNHRYSHHDEIASPVHGCVAPADPHNLWQLHKSLSCYLYQCTEGDIPDRPLYKALDKIKSNLAWIIVETDPRWEAAEWGDKDSVRYTPETITT